MSEFQKSNLPLTFLSLFSSLGTLICCALPALLVALGMGSVLAGLVSAVPQLIWISENKIWVLSFAALVLATAGLSIYYSRNLPCPVDPKMRAACLAGRKISLAVYIFSLIVFGIGIYFVVSGGG